MAPAHARLQPLASERELRFAEIAHELNLGGLFALAYADEYPLKPHRPDPDQTGPAYKHEADAKKVGA